MKTLLHSTALTLAAIAFAGAAGAQVNLTAATASPGSTPHLSVTHLATVAGERGIAALQVAEGQTLTNTILDVAQGRTDISAAPMLLPFLLSRGMGPFSAQGEEGAAIAANLRALYPYNAGSFNVLTLETSGIETWEDLRGRTVFNGPPRGAALTNARQAITLATGMQEGTDYTGHQANWGQLASLLVDGSMDAFVIPTTHPSDRVTLMASSGDVVVVSVPQETFESEAFQRVFQMPGNIPIEIEWDTIGYDDNVRLAESDDGILRGLGTAFADVVNVNMDYQLAYDLTTAHIETLDRLIASAPFARTGGYGVVDQRLSGFCGNNQLLYHPGAVAAWEDHGYDIPDCAEGQ
ncbi:TAXI family TRAP transporter solute-binding subunit [Pararhodobacter marinus]|uniref:C4-dicarboxylate ABC transporter substrate-binding protein n=1 Tax=Pararhodobacter marinus TaxID=2184063 RepID=A0A2U2CEX8_9RHOB|nr:TAXI family TRAP transporter solute-binding subunit [Pararhodobacter marinus]PWE30436.1 C4-dicarboxylate ABC transporter substrate-binding protein [Pararhodobacter marinus]